MDTDKLTCSMCVYYYIYEEKCINRYEFKNNTRDGRSHACNVFTWLDKKRVCGNCLKFRKDFRKDDSDDSPYGDCKRLGFAVSCEDHGCIYWDNPDMDNDIKEITPEDARKNLEASYISRSDIDNTPEDFHYKNTSKLCGYCAEFKKNDEDSAAPYGQCTKLNCQRNSLSYGCLEWKEPEKKRMERIMCEDCTHQKNAGCDIGKSAGDLCNRFIPKTISASDLVYRPIEHGCFTPKTDDPVHHPSHYTQGEVECIDAIRSSMSPIEFRGYLKGQVLKYIWRYDKKHNPFEDLRKAVQYLNWLVDEITEA